MPIRLSARREVSAVRPFVQPTCQVLGLRNCLIQTHVYALISSAWLVLHSSPATPGPPPLRSASLVVCQSGSAPFELYILKCISARLGDFADLSDRTDSGEKLSEEHGLLVITRQLEPNAFQPRQLLLRCCQRLYPLWFVHLACVRLFGKRWQCPAESALWFVLWVSQLTSRS